MGGEAGLPGSLGPGGESATFFTTMPVDGGGGGGLYGGGGGGSCYDGVFSPSDHSGSGGGGSSGAPGASNVLISTDPVDPPEAIITAPVPTAATPPTESGAVLVGSTLTEAHAGWSTSPAISSYTYQWQRCDSTGGACSAITGATAPTYTLAKADIGHTLRVTETATNFYGTGMASTSTSSGVVGEPPQSTAPPTISGTVRQGEVLDEAHGAWTDGPVGYAYQWLRCNSAGAACAPIVGAVSQAYTLATADVGSTIRVQETATNSYGATSADSDPTPAVAASTAGSPGGGGAGGGGSGTGGTGGAGARAGGSGGTTPGTVVLRALKVSLRSFSRGGRKVARTCRKSAASQNSEHRPTCALPERLSVRYTLSAATTVTFKITARVRGRRTAGRCVARTASNRDHKKCTRHLTVPGVTVRAGKIGTNRLVLLRKLAPGSYSLTARPTHGRPRQVTFMVIP